MGLNLLHGLAFISFTAPLMLLGILGISAPIIAHAMYRRSRKKIEFPTLALLKEARAGQSKLFRWRRWIVLSLRCLAIALIALSFTQPLWNNTTSYAENQPGAVIILIDVSGSTQADQAGAQVFDELTAQADRYLDGLEPGRDRVMIFAVGAQPTRMLNEATTNHDLVREQIRALRPTDESANFPAAFQQAAAEFEQLGGSKRLIVLSDYQKTDWTFLKAGATKHPALADAEIILADKPERFIDNLAIIEAQLTPAQPRVGRQATAMVRVANYSKQRVDTEVIVKINDTDTSTLPVQLAPGESKVIQSSLLFDEPGTPIISFQLPHDALPLDNTYYLKATVTHRAPVLYLKDQSDSEQDSAAFFITRALTPFGTDRDEFQLIDYSSLDMDASLPPQASTWLICDIAQWTPQAAERIADYLLNGGSAIWFMGMDASRDNAQLLEKTLAKQTGQPNQAMLPWVPLQHQRLDLNGDFRLLKGGSWNSAWLRAFDPAAQKRLGEIRFKRLWRVTPRADLGQTLLSYDDDSPALSLVELGEGRLLMANFTPSLNDSDLAKHGGFVALLFELMRELREKRVIRKAYTGESMQVMIPMGEQANGQLKLLSPSGQPVAFDHETVGDQLHLTMTDIHEAGMYELLVDQTLLDALPVLARPHESDLDSWTAEQMTEKFTESESAGRIRAMNAGMGLHAQEGRPFWHWLLVAGMIALGLECLLLGVYRQ